MGVRRNLRDVERNRFLAGFLTLEVLVPGESAVMYRDPALQVGQREGGRPVAAIHRAEQREQGRVLRDRQELPVTERPIARRKAEAERLDLSEERFRHALPPITLHCS